MSFDEDAVVCDLAETYNVHDMKAFTVDHIATLVKGLKENSRTKKKYYGLTADIETLLLAHIADNTALTWWMQSKDAPKGENRPPSLLRVITGKNTGDDNKEAETFESGADFDKKWRELNV